MTLINKIFIKNFKSFGKPTELIFGNKFNTIIGPNGSGKSNIFDAFCFVLGELSAKSMRAQKASNLIFNGGKQGSPSREAEVSIIFCNKNKEFPIDSNEIKITRIIRQNGQSTYKINNEKRTRQQILELLSRTNIDPDGHNIVLQGDIIKLTEMKPEERREVIEQIAGISIYESKKQQALNELNKVDAKVNEANIILTERHAYLKELKKERDQALKFKEYESRIKENKATNLYMQIKEKTERKQEIESQQSKVQEILDKINSQISEKKREIESKKKNVFDINKEIEEKGEIKQINLQKEIEELNTTVIKNTARTDSCRTEIKKINERKAQLQKDLEDIESKVQGLNKQKLLLEKEQEENKKQEKILTGQIQNFKQKHGIKDISILERIDKEIEERQNSFIKLQQAKQEVTKNKDKLEIELESINRVLDLSSSKEVKELQKKLDKLEQELNKEQPKYSVLLSRMDNSRKNANKSYEELSKLKAKQSVFQDSLSYDLSVNKLINSNIKGIHGIIAQLGTVEKKYSTAIEVAAGPRAKSLVVEDDHVAEKCIKYLKQNKLGVATFLPLKNLREKHSLNKSLLDKEGVLGAAVDLITFDKKYQKAFSYVFGSTLVVQDIETARRTGIGNARMVTLEGDIFETSGVIIGGFRRTRGIAFKEKDADLRIERLEKGLSLQKAEIKSLELKKQKQEDLLQELKNKKSGLTGEIIKLNEAYNVEEISRIRQRKENTVKEIKELDLNIKDLDDKIKIVARELENQKKERIKFKSSPNIKNQKVMVSLSELESNYDNVRTRIIQEESEIKNIREQTEKIHLPEKEKIAQIVRQHNKELNDFEAEVNELSDNLKKQKEELEEKRKQEVRFYNEYKGLFAQRNRLSEEIQRVEVKISTEEFKIKEHERKINDISIRKAKVTAELEALNIEFEEYKCVKIRRNISLEDLKSEIYRHEKLLKEMGNVNLKALEIYDEIGKEYDSLMQKMEKLRIEKEDVLKMMNEIESKKHSIFIKTFRAINENFKRIFLQLSTKGDAYLDLENKENPIGGGVDIKVRLAGTKFLDIKSLSGGEKTLTALAFIFAIQEHQPASFYLLDEVDAALDKTNSSFLSKLIKKYAEKAQYIMVSHNDNIITEADQVYGATMQKNGITKIISLKI